MANISFTQAPDSQNLCIYPTGNNGVNFNPSTGASNYLLIDDTWNNYDTTDFVYESDLGAVKDQYYLTNHTTETGTVNYVELMVYAKADFDTHAPTLTIHDYLVSEDAGSANTLTNSYVKYREKYTKNPSSGDWSWTDIDNLRAGFSGNITERDFYLKTQIQPADIARGVAVDSRGYIYVCCGTDGLKVYSYSDEGGFTLLDSNDQGGTYGRIYIDSDDVIYALESDIQVYTFDGTTLTHIDEYDAKMNSHTMTPYGIHGDGTYIYVAWFCSYYDESVVKVHEYTGGVLVPKDEYDTSTSYGDVTLHGIYTDGSYIYAVGRDEDEGDGRVWAFSYNSGTDTLTLEDTIVLGDVIRAVYGDGTYIYLLSNDYLGAYTFSAGSFSASQGSTVPPEPLSNFIVCDDEDYIYTTYGNAYDDDYFRIYTFNGSTFTTIKSFTKYVVLNHGFFYGVAIDKGRAFVGCDEGGLEVYNFSTIKVAQYYGVVNYTPSASTITLPLPKSLSMSHSRNINRFTFPNGNYEVEDMSRSGKTLSLTGWSNTDLYTKMQGISDMAHYSSSVSVTGLPDSNLNTDYYIRSFSFNQKGGEVSLYTWSVELEVA